MKTSTVPVPAEQQGQTGEVRKRVQVRRRGITRARILEAARRVFSRTPYIHATIDEIILEAGVSRATLYDYFESKSALATAIYDEIAPEVEALVALLPSLAQQDIEAIGAWLQRYIALYEDHRAVVPLLAQLQLFEEGFRQRLRADGAAHLTILSDGGIAHLDPAKDDGETIMQRARGRLMFVRIATLCGEIAAGEITDKREVAHSLQLAARELQQFLRDNVSL